MERKISYIVTSDDEYLTIEKILQKRLELTKSQIRSAKFRPDGIRLNGERSRINTRVQTGDRLEVLLESAKEGSVQLLSWKSNAAESYIDVPEIIYEDEDLAVVNKPSGLIVHPAHGHYADTLANQLAEYYQSQSVNVVIRAIGRLDKETSGAVLFAKNKVAAARLSQPECVKKEYLALVHGRFEKKDGTITKPIMRKSGHLNRMCVVDETASDIVRESESVQHTDPVMGAESPYSSVESAKHAVTHYQILKVCNGSLPVSLVKCWLETGRTHQIRVHMASIGHPLLGDRIYSVEEVDDFTQQRDTMTSKREERRGRDRRADRAMLHCRKMKIVHPFTGEHIEVTAPLPEDLRSMVEFDKYDLYEDTCR